MSADTEIHGGQPISEVLGPELTQKLLDINLKPNEFTPEVYSATLEMLEPFVVLVEGNSTPVGSELALRRQITLIEAGYILGYTSKEEVTDDPSDLANVQGFGPDL